MGSAAQTVCPALWELIPIIVDELAHRSIRMCSLPVTIHSMDNHSTGTSTKHPKERVMFHVPDYTAKGCARDTPDGIC